MVIAFLMISLFLCNPKFVYLRLLQYLFKTELYPTKKKKRTGLIFPLISPCNAKFVIVLKLLFLIKSYQNSVPSLCMNKKRQCHLTFWGRSFNDTVYKKFRIFLAVQSTKTILSLFYTSNEFIYISVCLYKAYSHQSGSLKLIETMLQSFHFWFISSMESLFKGLSHDMGYQAFSNNLC